MNFKTFRCKYNTFMAGAGKSFAELQSRKNDVSNSFLDEAGSLNLSAGSIIGFAIGLIVLAAVVPDAIGTFYSTNTSAWAVNGIEDTKTTVLWWLIPLVIVAAVVMMIYRNND